MGRAYRYDCDRCGYRVDICGGSIEVADFHMNTIHCVECRALYDVLSAIELPRPISDRAFAPPTSRFLNITDERWGAIENRLGLRTCTLVRKKELRFSVKANTPLAKRLTQTWYTLKIECPRNEHHRIKHWKEPGRCPRCFDYLQRGALPYREWD